ncbi:MAG: zf-HC2 domain-containing protein [Synergistaceae bacterium]|nr:zf-HC2 domain-containing protein [Synergistaceae bacterium]
MNSDDEVKDVNKRKIASCLDFELLISKECDGECTPEEISLLSAHLRECPECRRTLSIYREIGAAMSARFVSMTPPRPPKTRGVFRVLGRSGARTTLMRLGGVAACILFFIAGQFLGFSRGQREIAESTSNVTVATPSMWVEGRSGLASNANIETEQPYTESIGRYHSAIGEELRKEDVDWVLIRELVEAMGELRTDLELLTIHMAYLDIRTGSSPSDVAEHWEKLGKNATKTAYIP